jgi:L-seryl-tRNA(Ser) seleniumtransferase
LSGIQASTYPASTETVREPSFMTSNPLRDLPAVNDLLAEPLLSDAAARVGRTVVVRQIRACLEAVRDETRGRAKEPASMPTAGQLAERIASAIAAAERPSLRPVINATGILLHTGLGRAPLAEEAIEAIVAVARDYASVEIDLASGARSQRIDAVESLLCELTGAEAAVVANNNAGATLLALAAIAAGREVIVSRGQLIEIGGSFRLPDVMQASGATLREVGTTNKTRIGDYRAAIGPQTAALMRAHPSNYAIVGFTESASLDELVALGRQHQLPVIDDIGSGAMFDFAEFGFTGEPVAAKSIAAGADLVLFSGDKLLGGPQCGIAVGSKAAIGKLAKHPLMRALRVDKLTLAALAATLQLYRDPALARAKIPLLAALAMPLAELKNRAERVAAALASALGAGEIEVIASDGYLGGGAIPTQRLRTWCVALQPRAVRLDELARRLREGEPAILSRVQNNQLIVDLRTVPPRLDAVIATAIENALRLASS